MLFAAVLPALASPNAPLGARFTAGAPADSREFGRQFADAGGGAPEDVAASGVAPGAPEAAGLASGPAAPDPAVTVPCANDPAPLPGPERPAPPDPDPAVPQPFEGQAAEQPLKQPEIRAQVLQQATLAQRPSHVVGIDAAPGAGLLLAPGAPEIASRPAILGGTHGPSPPQTPADQPKTAARAGELAVPGAGVAGPTDPIRPEPETCEPLSQNPQGKPHPRSDPGGPDRPAAALLGQASPNLALNSAGLGHPGPPATDPAEGRPAIPAMPRWPLQAEDRMPAPPPHSPAAASPAASVPEGAMAGPTSPAPQVAVAPDGHGQLDGVSAPVSAGPGPAAEAGPGPNRTSAASVTGQVVHSLTASAPPGSGRFEGSVTLDPVELGRVVIRFEPDAGRPILLLGIERPETLELMRRNIDVLQSALRDLGHGGCDIHLGGGRQGATYRPATTEAPAPAALPAAFSAPAPPRGPRDGQLDLRL